MSLPPPFVHSQGFSHASAAYAQDPSRANLDRLFKEQEKVETKRVVFLLTRWMGFFGLGLAAFGVGKGIAQWQVRLRRRDGLLSRKRSLESFVSAGRCKIHLMMHAWRLVGVV